MPTGIYIRTPEVIKALKNRMIGSVGYWHGKKRSQNTKDKIREKTKIITQNRWDSGEFKGSAGYKHTPEARIKLSKNNAKHWLNKKRPPISQKHKDILSKVHTGRKFSQETKDKLSQSLRNGYKNGRVAWSKGKGMSKEESNWLKNKRNRIKKILNKNGSYHTFGEWELLKRQYNFICPCCMKSEPTIKLTEDHIIPLSVGGVDTIDNIQPLCKSCNCRKHTKIIKY